MTSSVDVGMPNRLQKITRSEIPENVASNLSCFIRLDAPNTEIITIHGQNNLCRYRACLSNLVSQRHQRQWKITPKEWKVIEIDFD